MVKLKKDRRILLILFFVIFFLITIIFFFEFKPKNKKEIIFHELYFMNNPSILNKLLNYVPKSFKESTKFVVVENFKNNEIICVNYYNYSFQYSKLYLVTANNKVIDFNRGELIGEDFQIFFDIKAFNFYLKQTNSPLNKDVVMEKMFRFLGNGCSDKRFYVLKSIDDIKRVLKEVDNKRNFFRKTNIDYNSIFAHKEDPIVWHNKYGIIQISLKLNTDFTIKKVLLKRLGYLGNENINL